MDEIDLTFTLAFIKLGGAAVLAIYLRVQAIRELKKVTPRATPGRDALTEA